MEAELETCLQAARAVYDKQASIYCPYFSSPIALTSDGFHHLRFKGNREPRNIAEQILKLRFVKPALSIIKKSGTLQEHRIRMEKVGKPARDGFSIAKQVDYWAFHAIIGTKKEVKIVVVLRRVGDGKITFWSVLPHKKFNHQKLYTEGIEED